MSMILTITDAGRQALVNAHNTGTLPLVISHVALGSAKYNPAKTQTTLQNEIKRLVSFGGGAVAPDVIHITIHDDSADTYALGEFGLITSTGVLFAVFSQTGDYILEKNANGILLLTIDTKIATLDITNVEFSGTNFLLPPASTTVVGVLKLADNNEALAGENNTKAMTAKTTKAVMDQHQHAEAAHHWNQITNKPASYPPSAHGHSWNEVADKPLTFPPSAHGHPWTDISGKPATFPATAHTHIWDDIPGMLPVAKLPFYYGIESYAGYVAQRDANGDLYARRYKGSGVELQDLNASSISSGVVNDIHLPVTQTGKVFTSPINVRADAGANPSYAHNQLVLRDASSGNPVALSFYRENISAVQLIHRANSTLELFGVGYGSYGDFALRNLNAEGNIHASGGFLFRPSLHPGGLLDGGIRAYASNAYNYGMGVNNNSGGLEFHASQAGAGMHRFYTGNQNTAVERMRITSDSITVDVSGNIRATTFYGDGSQITGINYWQLPWTPIQQSGGIGQLSYKINLGWSADAKLKCTVAASDYGNIAFESWVNANFSVYKPLAANSEAQSGTEQAIRQWSPALIKLAAETHSANQFGHAKKLALTITTNSQVWAGWFHYWIVGSVGFGFFEFAITATNMAGSFKVANLPANHAPITDFFQNIYSASVNSSALDRNVQIEINPSGEIIVHYENIFKTLSGSISWRIA